MTTIEVKNDYMLGRQNENILYYKCMELEQENKQLKEEIENIKDFNNKLQASKDRLDKDDYNLAHILTELEEFIPKLINENIEKTEGMRFLKGGFKINQEVLQSRLLDKIQELKEKYK